MKYTAATLKKLEGLFEDLDYTVRYEKGSFQSGYCLVENRRIAVVNRFFDTEDRINCLLDILTQIDMDPSTLPDAAQEFLQKALKAKSADTLPESTNPPTNAAPEFSNF